MDTRIGQAELQMATFSASIAALGFVVSAAGFGIAAAAATGAVPFVVCAAASGTCAVGAVSFSRASYDAYRMLNREPSLKTD